MRKKFGSREELVNYDTYKYTNHIEKQKINV